MAKVTKVMLEEQIKWLQNELKKKNDEIDLLKKILNFSPTFNFLTATMSTNKLARRMVETALDYRRVTK